MSCRFGRGPADGVRSRRHRLLRRRRPVAPISWGVWSCVLKTLSTAVFSVAPAYDDRKEVYERKISTLARRIASLLDGDPSDRRTGFDHMAFKVDTLTAVAFAIGLFIIPLAPETHGEVLPP